MEGKGLRQPLPPPQTPPKTEYRPRDSVIDEMPPQVTEKMGYVWVVKGLIEDSMENLSANNTNVTGSNEILDSNYHVGREKVANLIDFAESDKPDAKEYDSISEYRKARISSYIESLQRSLGQQDDIDDATYPQTKGRGQTSSPPIPQTNQDSLNSQMDRDNLNSQTDKDTLRKNLERTLNSRVMENLENTLKNNLNSKSGTTEKELGGIQTEHPTQEYSHLTNYIRSKLEEIELKLKRVSEDLNSSKDRKNQLQQKMLDNEIYRVLEKIAKDEVPSEGDVRKLEYLTDQVKIAKGFKIKNQ